MDGNPSSSFRVQADADIPTIAIRKALAYAGTITKCLPTASHAYILHFETEVALTSLVRMQSINNVNIKITKFDSFGSRGTIYHPEFSTWSLDEIQKEIGEGKVLRKLATKDRPAPVSGRVLLGFESPSLPTEVCVNILGEQLTVKQYIPGPLKCMECHVYGHHEKNCRKGRDVATVDSKTTMHWNAVITRQFAKRVIVATQSTIAIVSNGPMRGRSTQSATRKICLLRMLGK